PFSPITTTGRAIARAGDTIRRRITVLFDGHLDARIEKLDRMDEGLIEPRLLRLLSRQREEAQGPIGELELAQPLDVAVQIDLRHPVRVDREPDVPHREPIAKPAVEHAVAIVVRRPRRAVVLLGIETAIAIGVLAVEKLDAETRDEGDLIERSKRRVANGVGKR